MFMFYRMDRLILKEVLMSTKVQRLKTSLLAADDSLLAADAKPHNFVITNACVVKCRQARSEYMAALEKQNKEKKEISRELKRFEYPEQGQLIQEYN